MNSENSYEREIRKIVGDVDPIPSVSIVEVDIERGIMLETFVDQFFENLKVKTDSDILPFTKSDLLLYCDYLLEARINQVIGRRSLKAIDFQVKMPCFLHFVLCQIGECEIPSKQVIIRPKPFVRHEGMTMELDDVREFIVRIGNMIEMIAPKSVAKSFPSKKEGNVNFMTLTHVEETIRSDVATIEPVLVMASTLLSMARLDDMLTAHVSYGNQSRFKSTVRSLSYVGFANSQN